ncbi:MAG: L-threonylcarbamoyladenylate synthase [Alphaproteobacteria bacterium]
MPVPIFLPADAAGIARAAQALRSGELVAFPTETVYGLGADATRDDAVAKIFAVKERPEFNPLIIHVDAVDKLDPIIVWNTPARLLATRFWPGPLTLVLPASAHCPVSLLARAGLPSLAVRIPAHPIARALLSAVDVPIAAPSANRSGNLSPTTPLHVQASLGDRLNFILAAGRTQVGIESTILDLTGAQPTLLRPGGTSIEQIEQSLGQTVAAGIVDPMHPTSPGQLLRHYAPTRPLRLNVTTARDDEAFILFGSELGLRGGAHRRNLSPTGDLGEAAAHLFAVLHECDAMDISGIAVTSIPEVGLGRAINDRLRRAATP